MGDNPVGTFLGRYILSMRARSYGADPEVGGWLAVGAQSSLVFVDGPQPFDDTAYFDFYVGPPQNAMPIQQATILIQSVATGQYLAASGADMALFANAPTTAQAAQFFFVDGNAFSAYPYTPYDVPPLNDFYYYMCVPQTSEFDSLFVCANTVPESAVALVSNPSGDAATIVTLLCVTPGAAATSLGPTTATLSCPYFAGKYAIAFNEGWLLPDLTFSRTLPSDGSCLWIIYRQADIPTFIAEYPTAFAVVFQTMTGKFLQMPTGNVPGPVGLDGTIQSVGSAQVFAMWPAGGPAPDSFGAFANTVVSPVMLQGSLNWLTSLYFISPSSNGPVSAVTFVDYQENCGNPVNCDYAYVTRVVPGLQDLSAPGAQNWWDGADLRYVDMTTCVGSLTGPAAQWGNADLSFATLTGMDLTSITIGNAVNFTNAHLAGVQFETGQDLSQATLSGADLSGGVDLTAVTFGQANLTGTNLTSAKLTGVDLSQATCIGTIFSQTDLSTTKLPTATGALGQGSDGAVFESATVPFASLLSDWRNFDLSAATLTPLPTTIGVITADYAKFQNTILDGLTITLDTNNKGASFKFADLTSASLHGASLQYADFSSALLYAANLSNADLTGTTWSNAFLGTKQYLFTLSPYASGDLDTLNNGSVPGDLELAFLVYGHALQNPQVTVQSDSSAWVIVDGADTYSVSAAESALNVLTAGRTSAELSGACLAGADLTGGSFAGVHLNGVQLIGNANASGVDFEQADFTGANISSSTPNQPNLQNAALYGANLNQAFLFSATLQGAFLTGSIAAQPATLRGAMLAGTTLTGAQLAGTDMTDALIGLAPQGAPSGFAPDSNGIGVPLFTLDAGTFTPILNNWGSSTSAPGALQDAFTAQGISLSGPASLTPYSGQALWDISLTDAAGDAPPTPTSAGWVWTGFTIMQGQSQYQGTNDLVVYGTAFWMFAPNTTGVLQPEPYSVAATALTNNDMVGTTYCPNSRTWSTNQANGVPWEAAMTPASLTAAVP